MAQHGTRTGTVLALALGIAAATSEAQADCATPDFELLWTYPADGAQDVPTNAVAWVLATQWGLPDEVTLDGESLEIDQQPFKIYAFELPELSPDSDHRLVLRFPTHAASGPTHEEVAIDFRTGDQTAPAPAAPQLIGHTSQPGYADHACADVIGAGACFDTGEDTLLSVLVDHDATGADVIGWLVGGEEAYAGKPWPARCGDPSVFGHAMWVLDDCISLRAIGAGGLTSEPVSFCPDGSAKDGGVSLPVADASVPAHPDASTQPPGGGGEPMPAGDASLSGGASGTGMTDDGDRSANPPGTSTEAERIDAPEDSACSVSGMPGGRRSASVPLFTLALAASTLLRRRSVRAR